MCDWDSVVIAAVVGFAIVLFTAVITWGCVQASNNSTHLRQVKTVACKTITDPGYRALCVERA